MRFMLCARDRSSGAVSLLSEGSFATRREAVEAISGVRDLSGLAGADIFLVDLEAATPVAVVPWHGVDGEPQTVAPAYDEVAGEVPATVRTEAAAGAEEPPQEPETGEHEDSVARDELPTFDAVSLGTLEIDIDAWTCEDCIYISTCAKSGTLRPADCGAFQWRA